MFIYLLSQSFLTPLNSPTLYGSPWAQWGRNLNATLPEGKVRLPARTVHPLRWGVPGKLKESSLLLLQSAFTDGFLERVGGNPDRPDTRASLQAGC